MACYNNSAWRRVLFVSLFLLIVAHIVHSGDNGEEGSKKKEEDYEQKWKKKDVRDYTDADLERLYEQWEDNDEEELEEDELPEWKKPQPKIDLSKLDANDPEAMLGETKRGRTLMIFATVSGNPTEKETEEITKIWQGSLFNANYEVQRYVTGENRVLFMLKDGSKAWEIKDYLVQQDRCFVVTIEGKDYHGKGHPEYGKDENRPKSSGGKDSKKKKKKMKKGNENTTKKNKKENKDEL